MSAVDILYKTEDVISEGLRNYLDRPQYNNDIDIMFDELFFLYVIKARYEDEIIRIKDGKEIYEKLCNRYTQLDYLLNKELKIARNDLAKMTFYDQTQIIFNFLGYKYIKEISDEKCKIDDISLYEKSVIKKSMGYSSIYDFMIKHFVNKLNIDIDISNNTIEAINEEKVYLATHFFLVESDYFTKEAKENNINELIENYKYAINEDLGDLVAEIFWALNYYKYKNFKIINELKLYLDKKYSFGYWNYNYSNERQNIHSQYSTILSFLESIRNRSSTMLTIEYPVGSRDDPNGKEGLVHLLEHCLLKAKVGMYNLIDKLAIYGATINATTSINYLTIRINVDSSYLNEVIESYKSHIKSFFSEADISDAMLENEKNLIAKEMIRSKNEKKIENNILGNNYTLRNINKEDILLLAKKVQDSNPNIKNDNVNITNLKILKEGNVNNKKYCIVENSNVDDKFIAISIETNSYLRKNIEIISDALIKYLYRKSDAKLKITYSIGLIGLYISGSIDEINKIVINLMQINHLELMKYISKKEGKRKHILNQVDNDLLQLMGDSKKVTSYEDKSKLVGELIYNINNNLSFVTNITDETILRHLLEDKCAANEVSEDKVLSEEQLFSTTIEKFKDRKDISKNEYIQIWQGTSFFNDKKYIAHLCWALIDGIDGQLFKEFSLNESKFYSYKFYSREFKDYGYIILYVYDANKSERENIKEYFNTVIKKIYISLNNDEVEKAKKKLINIKKINNGENSKEYLNMAFYLSAYSSINEYYQYEVKINEITLDMVKSYLLELMKNEVIII